MQDEQNNGQQDGQKPFNPKDPMNMVKEFHVKRSQLADPKFYAEHRNEIVMANKVNKLFVEDDIGAANVDIYADGRVVAHKQPTADEQLAEMKKSGGQLYQRQTDNAPMWFRRSDIQKMTGPEYKANAALIREATNAGRIVMDGEDLSSVELVEGSER